MAGLAPQLRKLKLYFEHDGDEPLEFSTGEFLAEGLSGLASLKSLSVTDLVSLVGLAPPEDYEGDAPFLPTLGELRLDVNIEFTGGLEHLAELPSLRRVYVGWEHGYKTAVEDGALDGLTELTQITSLVVGHELRLRYTHGAVQEMENLRHLDLAHGLRARSRY